MPATAIDDRTFFILYALTKKPDLQISKLYSFYEECSFENIVKNLDILENFEIEIKLEFEPSSDIPLDIIKMIESHEQDILNSLCNIKNASLIVKKLIPYAITLNLYCNNQKKLDSKIQEYLQTSSASRQLYFYNPQKHFSIFKNVKEWATTTQTAPYKISINRFFSQTKEENNSKYAFFHFLYEQEKIGAVKIQSIELQTGEPIIIFENWQNKIHKPKEKSKGKILSYFPPFTLYENGIESSINSKFIYLEPLQQTLYRYCFAHNKDLFTYTRLAKILRISVEEVPKRISNIQAPIRKLLSEHKDVKIFNRVKGQKAYNLELKFTEK